MRARNIKPGFFRNPELADAGPLAQLLFAGLWCMADKEGRLKDAPRVIKAELFPYYEVDVNRELTVLARLGHVRRFVRDGMGIIEVTNFKKHQNPHHTEKASVLPGWDGVSACFDCTPEIHGEVTVSSPLENGEYPADSLIPDSLIQQDKKPPLYSPLTGGTKQKVRRVREKSIAHTMPPDWKPNSDHQELAWELGLHLNVEHTNFVNFHLAKGSKFVNWDRALNTWLYNAKKFERK